MCKLFLAEYWLWLQINNMNPSQGFHKIKRHSLNGVPLDSVSTLPFARSYLRFVHAFFSCVFSQLSPLKQ